MAIDDWLRVRTAFEQSAQWFHDTVPARSERWADPALGEWTIRDLVGHTSRALLTVETYLGKPASHVEVGSPADYFDRALATMGDPAAVAQRGRDAGAALGDDPADAVAEITERVVARLRSAEGETLVTTPVGGMRLVDYLPTRTFELTVHTCDLASVLGAPLAVPQAAADESLQLLARLASGSDLAGQLMLAATGRGPLPPGFTVL